MQSLKTLPVVLCLMVTICGFPLGLAAPVAASETGMEELTRLVSGYELSMARVEAYGAVLAGIGDWAVAHPEEAKGLRARAPKGLSSVEQAAQVIESEPELKGLLDRHQLSGRDFVLIPAALLQARLAVLGEAQGRVITPGLVNPVNLTLAKANAARLDALMHQAAADRVRAFGR